MTQDEEHLRLLSISHYIFAAVSALFCSFPLIHVAIGLTFIFAPDLFEGPGEPPPPWFGWLFVAIGSLFVIAGWTFAAVAALAGRSLARRKNYMFCFVVAALNCVHAPFGTVLGVFTIIVLLRDSVKALFAAPQDPFARVPTLGDNS